MELSEFRAGGLAGFLLHVFHSGVLAAPLIKGLISRARLPCRMYSAGCTVPDVQCRMYSDMAALL